MLGHCIPPVGIDHVMVCPGSYADRSRYFLIEVLGAPRVNTSSYQLESTSTLKLLIVICGLPVRASELNTSPAAVTLRTSRGAKVFARARRIPFGDFRR